MKGIKMSVIRLCICPCGRVSVQEPDVDPLCYKCGGRYPSEEFEWVNLDAVELKEDLENALEIIKTFKDKQSTSTETHTVTGGIATIFENPNKQ